MVARLRKAYVIWSLRDNVGRIPGN